MADHNHLAPSTQFPWVFIKHGRRGKPHQRLLNLDINKKQLFWKISGLGRKQKIYLKDIVDLRKGRKTDVFRRKECEAKPERCLSIVTMRRTLDMEAASEAERDAWYSHVMTTYEQLLGYELLAGLVRRKSQVREMAAFETDLHHQLKDFFLEVMKIWQRSQEDRPSERIAMDLPRLAKHLLIFNVRILEEKEKVELHAAAAEKAAAEEKEKEAKFEADKLLLLSPGKRSRDQHALTVTERPKDFKQFAAQTNGDSRGSSSASSSASSSDGGGEKLISYLADLHMADDDEETLRTRVDTCSEKNNVAENIRATFQALTALICKKDRATAIIEKLNESLHEVEKNGKEIHHTLETFLDTCFSHIKPLEPPRSPRRATEVTRPPSPSMSLVNLPSATSTTSSTVHARGASASVATASSAPPTTRSLLQQPTPSAAPATASTLLLSTSSPLSTSPLTAEDLHIELSSSSSASSSSSSSSSLSVSVATTDNSSSSSTTSTSSSSIDTANLSKPPSYSPSQPLSTIASSQTNSNNPSPAASLGASYHPTLSGVGTGSALGSTIESDEAHDDFYEDHHSERAKSRPPIVDTDENRDEVLLALLRVCNQSVVAPAVNILKNMVLKDFAYVDGKESSLVIEVGQDGSSVTHIKQEVSEKGKFSFVWGVSLRFQPVSKILERATLRILSVDFETDAPVNVRTEVSRRLFALNCFHEKPRLRLNQPIQSLANLVDSKKP